MARKWSDSRRRQQLPDDWEERRKQVAQRAGWRCEAMSQITDDRRIYARGIQCWREGTDCDHIDGRFDHDLSNLQWLCALHHQVKTNRESLEARRRLGPKKRPPEPHPGKIGGQ